MTGSDVTSDGPPRARVVVAALAAGVAAALLVPVSRAGLGWLLGGLAVAAGVVVARGVPRAPRRALPARIALALVAVGLLGAGVRYAAGWWFVLYLVAAGAAAAGALAGEVGWRRLALGWFAVPVALERDAVAAVRRAAGEPDARRAGLRYVSVALVSLGVAVVFGALLASADPAFAGLLGDLVPGSSPAAVLGGVVVFAAAAGAVLAARRLAAEPPRPAPTTTHRDPRPLEPAALGGDFGRLESAGVRRGFGRVEWAVPLVVLDGLFVMFVGVQVTVLFAGDRYVLGRGGPDYAQYARSGFGQLLVVAVLVLAALAVLARRAARRDRADRVLFTALAGVLCGLTVVILASAVRRLALYEAAYGFTRPRLFAVTFAVFLAVVLLCVMVAGTRAGARWLPRGALLAAVTLVLVLAGTNPDATVARTVIGRYHKDGHLDRAYLSTLSVDAVPAVDRLPEPDRSCILAQITQGLGDHDPWYAYDAGRERARAILRSRPLRPCRGD